MRTKIKKYLWVWWLIPVVCWMNACQTYRHLEPDQFLVRKATTVKTQNKIPAPELESVIQLQPNRRMLLPKTYLHLYNMGLTMQKDSSWLKRTFLRVPKIKNAYYGFTNWLVNGIGEPPVLLKMTDIYKDTANLRNACFARGYFFPRISYRIDTLKGPFARQKVNVRFSVDEGEPFKISRIIYQPPSDSATDMLQHYDTEANLLKPGDNYNQNVFAKERARATEALRNNGYFSFSQGMISFLVDTTTTVLSDTPLSPKDSPAHPDSINQDSVPRKVERKMNVTVEIREEPMRYRIRHVTVILKESIGQKDIANTFSKRLRSDELTPELRDSLGISHNRLAENIPITFMVERRLLYRVNYNFLARRVHIREGAYYSQAEARKTRQRLQELGMFQYVLVKFGPVDSLPLLDVEITLQTSPNYQIKAGMEAFTTDFNTSNLPGIGANFSIRNKNTFRKSELFEFGILGNFGFYTADENVSQFENVFYELGANASLSMNDFLLPAMIKNDLSSFSPRTSTSAKFRLEHREEYERTTVGTQLLYRWNHIPFSDKSVSQFSPLALDLIDIDTDSTFQREIVDNLPPAIKRDFEERFSSRVSYNFTYQNYGKTRAYPTYWLRVGAEIGGNLPFLIDNINGIKRGTDDVSSKDNLLFNRLFYGQYGKVSLEYKYMIPLRDNRSDLVFRGYIGAALPYNNTPTVPQESRFFSGGTNSMRGWVSNTLGPGTSSLSEFQTVSDSVIENIGGLSLIAPGGEWILELNAEYRLRLISFLELALFTDVGNVWFNNTKQAREQLGAKSVLTFDNLRMGWDAGIGMRFDFSFIILRLDIGQQIYAPDIPNGWVPGSGLAGQRTQLNLGIGYPF